MTQYLPYIFGTVSLLGGIYVFLLAFKIYVPKQKTENGKQKMKDWHKKFGTMMKVGSIFLILNGSYDLFSGDSDRYNIGTSEKTEWENGDKDSLVKVCIKDAKPTTEKNRQRVKKYCDCSLAKIISNMTYKEYTEILNMENDKQMVKLKPIIQDCMIQLKQETDKKDK